MGDRESYPPGTFSWASLGGGQTDFYARLFGWEAGEEAFTLDGKRVAGRHEGEPGWLSYVTVEDVAAAAERAQELGGEAEDGGAVTDPTGAVLRLWQGDGAERVNDPGCMVWNELATPDPERARTFYTELLGWTAETDPSGYTTIKAGETPNGGLRLAQHGEAPQWLVYFTVEQLDEATKAATEAGGTITAGPFALPAGRMAIAADPQRASFALFEGTPDP